MTVSAFLCVEAEPVRHPDYFGIRERIEKVPGVNWVDVVGGHHVTYNFLVEVEHSELVRLYDLYEVIGQLEGVGDIVPMVKVNGTSVPGERFAYLGLTIDSRYLSSISQEVWTCPLIECAEMVFGSYNMIVTITGTPSATGQHPYLHAINRWIRKLESMEGVKHLQTFCVLAPPVMEEAGAH